MRLDKLAINSRTSPPPARKRAWTPLLSVALAGCIAVGATWAADPLADLRNAPPEIVALIDRGDFRQAETRIAEQLRAPDVSPDLARALAFERERMRRIRLDFPYDEARVRADLKKVIPDLREDRSEEHTSELQSQSNLVCRLLLEKKKQ